MDEKEKLPRVGIIILNYNGEIYLRNLLPLLIKTNYNNFYIMVADNGSTDNSEEVTKQYERIFWLKNNNNLGFAGGYNWAVKNSPFCEYLVLLNSDVAIDINWLEPMVNLLKNNSEIAACQSKLLDFNNRSKFEYSGAAGGWLDVLGFGFTMGRIIDTIENDHGQYDTPREIFWACGAAFCIKKEIFLQLKGFDSYFFAHFEEIDLCWRLQLLNYKIYSCPQSIVYHIGGGTLPSNHRKLFLNHRNNLLFLWKNLVWYDKIWILPIRYIVDHLIALAYLVKGYPSGFIMVHKAHLNYYKAVFTKQIKTSKNRKSIFKLKGIYYKSIIVSFFIKNKKYFSQLDFKKN